MNNFLEFKDAKDKGIGTTMLIGLPILVLVIFIIAFTKKTKLDLCNSANYTCNPPTSGSPAQAPAQAPTQAPAQAPATQQKTEKFDVTSCGKSNIIPGHDLVDSSSTINGYKKAAIALILIAIAISIAWSFTSITVNGNPMKVGKIPTVWANWGLITKTEQKKHMLYFWVMLIGIFILAIITFVYLSKKKATPNDKHVAFSISFIALLINIIIPLYIKFGTSPAGKGANAILIAILLVFTINTIVFHTTQTTNLDEGKITYAMNESAVNTMAPMMIIIGLANMIIGGAFIYINLINSKKPVVPKLIFGITQLISGILLIAGASYFYSYKAQCNDSPVYCKLEFKRVDRSSGNEVCVPYSDMAMNHTSSIKMGSAIGGLMLINQIVGFISILMIAPPPLTPP